MCKTVVIFRSMNGFTSVRIGGTGARAAAPVAGDALHARSYGWQSAGQMFAPSFMRHMYDYGTTAEQVAAVRVAHSHHASNNPKAFYKKRVTVDDVVNSRMICKPLHLLDCCVETDNANAIIVTSRRARARLQASPGADPRRGRPLLQAARGHALPDRPDLHRRRPLRQGDPLAERRRRPGRRRSDRLVRRLHLHHHAAARGLRLLQEGRGRSATSATARSSSAASGRTTPRAATCARPTPTASPW